jgi:hypothetical protein
MLRLLPLFSQERGYLLKQGFGFLAYEAIGGDHERSEMTALLKTSIKVFPLFLLFVCF